MISVTRPSLGSEELAKVSEVFQSGWLGLGKVVEQFETGIKTQVGARNAVAVNTGTSAIHLALDCLGVGPGDEVLVPSLTFVATVQAIVMTGATPVFCDIEEATLNIDVSEIRRKLTSRTKAVVPVHYSGIACDLDAITSICHPHGIKIVEDAAHAFGSTYKGRPIGSIGDATCFSFDPIKIITCGEGGAVTTHDDELAENMRRKRILGMEKETWKRYNNQRSWFYEVTSSGFRYHLSNINAAIGLVQLGRLAGFLESRRAVVRAYDDAFSRIPEIQVIAKHANEISPFNYIIRVPRRDDFMRALKERGIDTGVHYIPNHTQPYFSRGESLPVTEKVAQEIVTLPLSSHMPETEVQQVIQAVVAHFGPGKGIELRVLPG